VDFFKTILKKWNENFKRERDVKLETLRSFINLYPELASFLKELDEISIPIPSIFALTALDKLYHLLKSWGTNEDSRKAEIIQEVSKQFKSSYPSLIECHEECPMCFSKCTKCTKTEKGRQHSAQYHILPAFRGLNDLESNATPLHCCFDREYFIKKKAKKGIFSTETKYFGHDTLKKSKTYSVWIQNLPEKEKFKFASLEVSDVMKECWVGTKEIFLKHYGFADTTPDEWLQKVPPIQRLRATDTIEGYDISSLKKRDLKKL